MKQVAAIIRPARFLPKNVVILVSGLMESWSRLVGPKDSAAALRDAAAEGAVEIVVILEPAGAGFVAQPDRTVALLGTKNSNSCRSRHLIRGELVYKAESLTANNL